MHERSSPLIVRGNSAAVHTGGTQHAARGAVLQLEARGEPPIALDESAELARLLDLVRLDPEAHACLTAQGVAVGVLLPAPATPDEPQWLRAEELLDEAAACPGERLLAQSLAMAGNWHRACEIIDAARMLAAAIRTEAALPEAFTRAALLRGCAAIETATSRLQPARHARLVR